MLCNRECVRDGNNSKIAKLLLPGGKEGGGGRTHLGIYQQVDGKLHQEHGQLHQEQGGEGQRQQEEWEADKLQTHDWSGSGICGKHILPDLGRRQTFFSGLAHRIKRGGKGVKKAIVYHPQVFLRRL